MAPGDKVYFMMFGLFMTLFDYLTDFDVGLVCV